MEKLPKLLFLIPHLGGGGAEQVTSLLLQNLCPQKYDLHLGLVTPRVANHEALPPHISIHGLGASRVRASAFQLLVLVWKLRPDLIFSGMAHLNFLVLMLRPFFPHKTRVLVRQNSTVLAALAFGDLPRHTGLLYRLLYRRADRVVCQTQKMAQDLATHLRIPSRQTSRLIAVLPNPINVTAIQAVLRCSGEHEKPLGSGEGPQLLAVGRLAREKGFDLLLRAFLLVRTEFPTAQLVIVGSGPEELALKRLARDLHLDAATHFVGRVPEPAVYFANATGFVLSSHHEGMPNALLEAAAGGLPLIITPSSSGIVELLSGHAGVWLAEATTPQALAASILSALRALLPGQRFSHLFVNGHRLEHSIAAYESLIDSVLAASPREQKS